MMLMLNVFYGIPRCDLNLFFSLNRNDDTQGCRTLCCPPMGGSNGAANEGGGASASSNADPERIRLQSAKGGKGPKYTQHLDEPEAVSENFVFLPKLSRSFSLYHVQGYRCNSINSCLPLKTKLGLIVKP